jgi:hypothetical protein
MNNLRNINDKAENDFDPILDALGATRDIRLPKWHDVMERNSRGGIFRHLWIHGAPSLSIKKANAAPMILSPSLLFLFSKKAVTRAASSLRRTCRFALLV